jgi:hypothetical protein
MEAFHFTSLFEPNFQHLPHDCWICDPCNMWYDFIFDCHHSLLIQCSKLFIDFSSFLLKLPLELGSTRLMNPSLCSKLDT